MAIRVCADTITDITSSREFHGSATEPNRPTASELIKEIRNQLHSYAAEARARAADPEVCPHVIVAEENEKLFNQMMDDVPAGFRLVPVFYKRIDVTQNDRIMSSFSRTRGDFMKFLGQKHAKELKKLGICDHGIARMCKGQDPASKDNRYYDVSVDHIIERAGSGRMSTFHERDKDSTDDRKKSLINHYGNLILLPEAVHEYKNRLHVFKSVDKLQTANTRWILTLAPERDDNHAGFVAQPQTSGRYRTRFINDKDAARAYVEATTSATRAGNVIEALETADSIKWLTRSYAAICRRPEGKQSTEACAMVDTLKTVLENDAALAKKVDKELVPAIRRTVRSLSGLFNGLSHKLNSRRDRAAFEDFVALYQSGVVGDLRAKVESLPVEAVAPLTKVFSAIDRRIESLYTAFGEPKTADKSKPETRERGWEDRKVHHGAGRSSRAAA